MAKIIVTRPDETVTKQDFEGLDAPEPKIRVTRAPEKTGRPLEPIVHNTQQGSNTGRGQVGVTRTIGSMGTAIYGGYIVDKEKDALLTGVNRYRTYSEIMANTTIVAAGVRYFMNLGGSAQWKIIPHTEEDGGITEESQKMARFVEQVLFKDMVTTWDYVVRYSLMHRFMGFAAMEWTAQKREDGNYGYSHIEARPQWTIEQWDADRAGRIKGIVQRSPQDQRYTYLPRGKIIYAVDHTLSDDPRGVGIFRHIVKIASRLDDYEVLEQQGFRTDMRGIPIAFAPLAEIEALKTAGKITAGQAQAAINPIINLVRNHIRGTEGGMVLESDVFKGIGEDKTPIAKRKYEFEILNGGSMAFSALSNTIERINREIARVLGVEQLLLGSDSTGSLALSRDKSRAFFLQVNAALSHIAGVFQRDIINPLWLLNGFDPQLKPTLFHEQVEHRDPDQITTAIKDLATAGITMFPEDESIGEVFDALGLTRPNVKLRKEKEKDQLEQDKKLAELAGDEKRVKEAEIAEQTTGTLVRSQTVSGGNTAASQGNTAASQGNTAPGPRGAGANRRGSDPGGSADDKLRADQGQRAQSRRQRENR